MEGIEVETLGNGWDEEWRMRGFQFVATEGREECSVELYRRRSEVPRQSSMEEVAWSCVVSIGGEKRVAQWSNIKVTQLRQHHGTCRGGQLPIQLSPVRRTGEERERKGSGRDFVGGPACHSVRLL